MDSQKTTTKNKIANEALKDSKCINSDSTILADKKLQDDSEKSDDKEAESVKKSTKKKRKKKSVNSTGKIQDSAKKSDTDNIDDEVSLDAKISDNSKSKKVNDSSTSTKSKNKSVDKNNVDKTAPQKKATMSDSTNVKTVSPNSKDKPEVPESLVNNVLKHSDPLPLTTPSVRGYDFNEGINYSALFRSYRNSGFQATNFGLAVEEILRMLVARRVPLTKDQEDIYEDDEFIKRRHGCTIFLGYTSNMASCGVRDTIRFLAEHRMIDCIVTSAGGVEEDFIKCLAPTYLGDFHLDGKTLRDKGINRIGNLLVPNDNYCLFEDWVMPILDKMLEEQKKGILWTPSKVIARLGEEINNRESIYYWAAKNKIPVFCPALTDGSLGDMMYFHSFKNPGLVIDIVSDLRRINTMAMKAVRSGIIIIGGGVVKHHICNANLMRNGADFGVFLNTAHEFDGSDSGARPDEAVSWGKIKKESKAVKICAEASLVFPLLVAETFVRHFMSYKMRVVTTV